MPIDMSSRIIATLETKLRKSSFGALDVESLGPLDDGERRLVRQIDLLLARLRGERQARLSFQAQLLGDVDQLADTLERVALGAFDVRVPEMSLPEMDTMRIGVEDMNRQLKRYNEALEVKVGQLERNEEQLRTERELAETATRAKSSFLANMSHEIRTPLNAILGLCDLSLRTALNAQQRDYIRKARHSAQLLLGIISDVLDFSKIEEGKLRLERSRFRLDKVLDDVVSLFDDRFAAKRVSLRVDVAEDVPTLLLGDELRLGQVLINLLGNAIKFTDQGQVALIVRREEERRGELVLRFTVRDSGIGISEEKLPRLFEAFTQADSSTTRRYGGTGLGLSICKRLVEKMGGSIEVQSQLGRGSSFSFTIVLQEYEWSRDEARVPDTMQGLRILVADDDEQVRLQLLEFLAQAGFRARGVQGGAQALEALREAAAQDPFALTILDWKMPDMDGIETTMALRADARLRSMPVIMVTAYGREDVRWQAERLGVRGFLLKPIKASMLLDVIVSTLGSQAALTARVETVAQQRQDLKGLRVLLVEDNLINQQVAKELLEDGGAQIEVVEDGEQAVRAVAGGRHDIVLMDIQMPRMDGLEATRAIREGGEQILPSGEACFLEEEARQIPIVAMTAHVRSEDQRSCLAAGMDDYLSKPFEVERLLRTLAHWTGRRAEPGAAKPPRERCLESLRSESSPIDVQAALQRIGGREKLLWRVLEEIARDHAQAYVEIRRALEEGNLSRANRRVHTIKGLAGFISSDALSRSAMILEMRLKDGERENEEPLLEFEAALRRVVEAIEDAKREAPPHPSRETRSKRRRQTCCSEPPS